MTQAGGAFAAPGTEGYTAMELEPGRYMAICFLPEGATPENLPKLESGEIDGAPHFTLGMISEFSVE